MPHRKYSSPRSHRSSSRDRKRKSSSPKHDQRGKQRKPGSKCAQIKQLKALLASLRKEGAAQTSEFIDTLLRNPACRTAAQGISTPESAYMAIANQALNDAAQNRESIENSRIASDGSARGWFGNKLYKLQRGVSNHSGKIASAVLIAACVALYTMYGPEAIQNATGQAFSSIQEYVAWLAAQPGKLLTKLQNYFSGAPPSEQTVQDTSWQLTPGAKLIDKNIIRNNDQSPWAYAFNKDFRALTPDEQDNARKYYKKLEFNGQLENLNVSGGALLRKTAAAGQLKSDQIAPLPKSKRPARKSSLSPLVRKTKTMAKKPAKKAVKRSKSPKSKSPKSERRNNDSIKSSHGMTLRKRT